MNTHNYLVFDDHPVVASAVKILLKSKPTTNEVKIALTSKEALNSLRHDDISLLILDVNLNDCDGFDFLKRIRAHGYKGKVVFFSAESSSVYSQLAFRHGADGYVCKSESNEILHDAVEMVLKGYSFFKFNDEPVSLIDEFSLSSRETTVMKLLIQGKTNREIADILTISDKTVSTYKRRILDKVNVKNVVELTKFVSTT